MRAVLCLSWLLSSGAWAQPATTPTAPADPSRAAAPVMPSPVSARVEVEILVVEGLATPGPSDARLDPLLPTLKTTGFPSFRLLDRIPARMADAETQQVKLAEGRELTVQVISHDLQQAQVRLALRSGTISLVDTTITVHRNKAFYLVVRGHGGRTFILPVAVRY